MRFISGQGTRLVSHFRPLSLSRSQLLPKFRCAHEHFLLLPHTDDDHLQSQTEEMMRVIILLHWRSQLLTLDGRARPSKALLRQIGMITERSVHLLLYLCALLIGTGKLTLPGGVCRGSGLFQAARSIWARKEVCMSAPEEEIS